MGIYSLIILFLIYLLWMKINNVNIIDIKNVAWIKDDDPGPLTYYIKLILKKYIYSF